jgi:hypothetical protein
MCSMLHDQPVTWLMTETVNLTGISGSQHWLCSTELRHIPVTDGSYSPDANSNQPMTSLYEADPQSSYGNNRR